MSGKPQKHVHKINNFPIAASKAVPGSSLDADISALNDKLSTKKDRQDPVASPDADGSGIAFIDTLSQDTNGKITVTKKNVQQASTSSAGIVQLSSKIDSTSETMAATPKAVHDAIIEAEQATVAGLNAENTVPDGHYITSVDETDGFVSITTAAMDDVPTQDSTKPVKSGGVFASIGAEANDRAAADAAFQQLIPPAASEYNQLADKAYVDAIGERVEARYLSYSQDGLPFPTYDDFVTAQQTDTFYYMNALTAPNNNDVIVITADRTHLNENGQPTTTRWRFFKPETVPGEWRYEYTINNSALSEAQLLAINSGINAAKVGNYDAHLNNCSNPHHVTAAQVGLGNVNNTADLAKPISTATQTALDEKADNVVDGTANHIVVLGDNGKTLVDSHAAITSSYDGTDEINPVTGSAVAAAIGELDAGPFGGEGKYIVSVSETAGVVTATEGTLDAEPTENSTNPVKSGGVYQHLSTKADKDTDAVENNVAVFDGNGSPVDGGISKGDLEAAISSAGSSIQGVSIDGTALTPGANNVVDIPLATTTADGAMSADDKAKLDGIASGAEVNVQADWSETDSTSDAFIQNKPNLATVATTGEYGDLLHIPADLVHDASYVHTDNNYTAAEKEKLSGIESGAEVNVQSDWTESDSNSDAFIKNKPENLVQDADYVHTDNNYTTAEKEKLAGIEDGAEVNVIETVKVDDIPLTVTDKTVNIDLSGKADKAVPSAAGNLARLDDTGNLKDSGIPGTLDPVPTENSGNLVTSGTVYDALDGKANKVSGATPGNFAGLDVNGNLTDSGKSYADLAGAFKAKQSPVNDPAASGTAVSFIDTIEQDSDGEIAVTKKTVPSASSTQDGLMSSADWSKLDALPDASTLANDLAAKADKDADAVEGNLAVFDGNGNPVDSGAKITSDYDGSNSTDPVTGAAVGLAIADKADKVLYATEGNFAGLDAKGNLTDSGSKASDFAIFGHSHGNISNDGKVGSTAGLSVVTTTGGEVTVADLATADVAASGTTLTAVTAVTQDSKGKISVEKKTIQDGTTAQKGVVQLSSATDSDSETMAATPKAVSDLAASLGAGKADKVSGATSGNFAALDSNGNLTDSGKKASDFATAAQGSKADTAIQGVKVNGTELTKDSLNKVGITAVTGVKGSSESTYRTGQVSITAGNVGAYTTTETDAALALKEDTANKKQTVNASSTTEFPSSAAVAAFVNSSIATATANFLGNYTLTDLGLAYPATNAQIEGALETHTWPAGVTPTNNDYVLVSINSSTDPVTGEPIIDEYRRFKYNDGEGSWAYEYTLNNSSFTSAQWGAINSGITAGDKSAYDDHLADTSNPHSVTAAQVGLGYVDNTADIDKPISTATQAALDDKVDKVYTATENHIAVFDNAGNIKDSGKTYADMQGEFKRKQTAKSSPTASGNTLSFIDTVSQDAEGVITATKKSVTVDSTYSSSGTNPVNGKAIKAAIDGLDAAITSNDGTNVQVKVTETDGKISAVNITSDNTENKNNKVSTWQATPDNTHYPSEKLVKAGLDAKADADKVVAIADARIDRNGTDGWFKIASKAFNSNGVVLKFQWIVSALGSADNLQNVTFFLNLTIGFGSSGSNPYIGRFETSPIKKDSIGCDFKAIVNGTVGNATIELWAKVGSRYGSVAIRELQAGNFRGADAKGFLTYASYSPSDAGSSEEPTGNVSKKLTFVYVQEVIASPTKDNLVAMDANGLVKDSGLAKSSVESAISKAGSAIQGVKVNGTTLTPDANKVVTVPLATKSADGAMSAADKTKLDGIAAGAEVNQNAFGNVKVGSTTVAADSKTDTLELASSSAITLTPDAANDKVTIGVSTMGAASSSAAGTAGIVPAPGAGKQASFLRGDGTWVVPTNTDTLVKATAKTDNVNYKILATASASPTSGNATEAVYDTDISLNPSTNTITSNISGNAATATKPAVTTLTASDNLNNVGGSTAGDVLWYTWASGSAPANVPTTGSAVMEVVRTNSGNYITQTVYTTDQSVYRRECINGTWGSWYAYSKSTHTHGNITSGGALQTTDVAIANGDKLVITDASDSNKVARSSTAFDGSTITKALTQKGTFESVVLADDAMPLSAADGVKITYSGSTATISGNFAAGAGVGITYANNVATFSADISAIPLATIYALS